MSLINQMLRDLDRREVAEGARPVMPPGPVAVRPQPKRWGRQLYWLLPVIVVLMAGVYFEPRISLFLSVLTGPGASSEQASRAEPGDKGVALPMMPAAVAEASAAIEPVAPERTPAAVEQKEAVAEHSAADAPMPISAVVQSGNSDLNRDPILASNEPLPRGVPGQADHHGQVAVPLTGVLMAAENADAAELSPSAPSVAQADVPLQPALRQPVAVTIEQPLVRVKKVAPKTVRESAENVFAGALVQLNDGLLREAEASLRHTLMLDRAHVEARRLLVMLRLNAGERNEAAALLDEGLDFAPASVPLVVLRGRLLMEEGDLPRAIRLLEQQRAITGEHTELLSLLGSAYQQAQQFSEAVRVYRGIIEQQPENARALAGLAISLDATGAYGEALARYREALTLETLPAQVTEYARKRVSELSLEQ